MPLDSLSIPMFLLSLGKRLIVQLDPALCSVERPTLAARLRSHKVSDLFPVKRAPLRMGRLSPEVSLENQYVWLA